MGLEIQVEFHERIKEKGHSVLLRKSKAMIWKEMYVPGKCKCCDIMRTWIVFRGQVG